jgi:hypothetical protein
VNGRLVVEVLVFGAFWWSASTERRSSTRSAAASSTTNVGGLGCWTATSTLAVADASPKQLNGCITIWDQIRLFEDLL